MGVMPPAGTVSWLEAAPDVGAVSTSLVADPSAGTVVVPTLPAGGYMGEGLLPIPERLVKKITELTFVEMRDLMPEVWLREEEEAVAKNVLVLPKKKAAPITDINQWVQCFAGYVGVLSVKYGRFVPELMAYMATIVKCAKDFDGVAWAQYDRAYRKQMAQRKELRWSRLNPTLFSLCFAGKAKRNATCAHCLADTHTTDQCPDNPVRFWGWQAQERERGPAPAGNQQRGRNTQKPICFLFNKKGGNECSYNPCKFAHLCLSCKGNHPRSSCAKAAEGENPGPAKRPRSSSS